MLVGRIEDILREPLPLVRQADRAAACADEGLDDDEYSLLLGAFRLKAVFPELVEGLPFAPSRLILFLLDKIPRFLVSKGECREQTE